MTPIPGFPGYFASRGGDIKGPRGRLLIGDTNKQGHNRVWVRGKKRFRHQLILLTFVGPPPPGKPNGLHWDDDPSNNQVENLRWGSYSENTFDKVRNGNHTNANKTHCPRRHEYDSENTYVRQNGKRVCRACARDRQRAKYQSR